MRADRVRETTDTIGTGTFELNGPVTGRRSFVAAYGTGAAVRYVAENADGTEWEIGEGTITDAAPDTLSRTTIVRSSNGNNAVNFSTGTKRVYPAPDADATRFGIGDIPTATGTADARVITYAPAITKLRPGMKFWFINGAAANTGAATLQVDAVTADDVKRIDGSALVAGDMPASAVIGVVFDGTQFRLLTASPVSAMDNLIGVAFDYGGSVLPAGYIWGAGQNISRTTYAKLFARYSTTHGAGDGSTTFGVPDLRGRITVGRDDMNGSAASRVTAGGSGITGTSLGASGGNQLLQQHAHGVNDPTHAHTYLVGTAFGVANAGPPNIFGGQGSAATSSDATGISIQNAGSGSSQNMPPVMIMNKIIWVGV